MLSLVEPQRRADRGAASGLSINSIPDWKVTMMSEYLARQHDLRVKAWEEAKSILDTASTEQRDLSAEEQQSYDRITEDMSNRAAVIEHLKADEDRALRLDALAVEVRADETPLVPVIDEAAQIRSLARGEVRSLSFEKRAITTGSTGAPVPTSFYDRVIMQAHMVGPMLETSTVITTTGGENLQIPSISSYSAGTAFAQGSAIGVSEPIFNSFITLSAYKYSFLVQLSREMIEDSGVDIFGFLAAEIGNGIGYTTNGKLTVGTGTVEPKGIVTASAAGGTGSTAVSGAFTGDQLIDLVYTIDGAARLLPGNGFMMNAKSIAAVRKLKDTAGNYIFSPALSTERQDLLLGYPIYENPAMVDPATSAKSVIFGNLKSYFVRQAGGVRVDRSDEYAFNTDLVTFRVTHRVDGNLPQVTHVKHFVGGAS